MGVPRRPPEVDASIAQLRKLTGARRVVLRDVLFHLSEMGVAYTGVATATECRCGKNPTGVKAWIHANHVVFAQSVLAEIPADTLQAVFRLANTLNLAVNDSPKGAIAIRLVQDWMAHLLEAPRRHRRPHKETPTP